MLVCSPCRPLQDGDEDDPPVWRRLQLCREKDPGGALQHVLALDAKEGQLQDEQQQLEAERHRHEEAEQQLNAERQRWFGRRDVV
jgi:hypothetical protein